MSEKELIDVITDLVTRDTALTAENLGFDGITDNVRGYTIDQILGMNECLITLIDAYDLIVQEDDAVLTFRRRADADIIELPTEDLAAHEPGEDAPRPWEMKDFANADLPNEVNVQFYDPNIDYQKADQSDSRNNFATNNKTTVGLPLVLTASQAKTIARRILFTAWLNRTEVTLQLSPKYIHLQENDILKLPDIDDFYVRVLAIERGHNYLLRLNCVIEKTLDIDFTATAEEGTTGEQEISIIPEVAFFMLDIAPMSSSEIYSIGAYIAAGMMQAGQKWLGADLYVDSNGDEEYELLSTLQKESTIAVAAGTLADGEVDYWDRENTLDVDLLSGELESKTELAVLNGANRLMVGSEIIAFTTVTFISGTTYRLSNLLRGLRDTKPYTGTHQANEMCVLLDNLEFQNIEISALNVARNYKLVPKGIAVDDIAAENLTPTGKSLKPFAPCHITGSRDGSNNLTINWIRRTRIPIDNPSGVPFDETQEKYEIDIYDGATVVRTIEITGATAASYTAAEQTADGLTPGDPVVLKIYQLSAIIGRGNEGSATI